MKRRLMSRPPMVTTFVCSVLASPRSNQTRSRKHVMPSHRRYATSDEEWSRSWWKRYQLLISKKLLINCKWYIEFVFFLSLIQWKAHLSIFIFRKPDSIGRDIERKCNPIFPLHDVFIRKVKVLKKPKFECKSHVS